MTLFLLDTFRAYLGWCPHARPATVAVPPGGFLTPDGDLPDTPQSPATPGLPAVPSWMTAVSIAILFATCFVGGNLWWPILVLGVLLVFIMIQVRTIQTHRRP